MRLTSTQKSFIRIGLPMLTLLVGGSYGLSFFIQGRNEARDRQKKFIAPSDPVYKKNIQELEEKRKNNSSLSVEQEYEKMQKEVNWDDYVNVRTDQNTKSKVKVGKQSNSS